MINTFLSGLLLALCFSAQAAGSYVEQPNLGGSKGAAAAEVMARPSQGRPAAQDTAKGDGKPLFASARLVVASVRPQLLPDLAKLPDASQLTSPEATALDTPEFDVEAANLPAALAITLRRPAAPMGRRSYRTRLVRTGRWATRSEAVEILTCTYAGPLVLAQLPATTATPGQLLAGPGYDTTTPLRPLELTQAAVLRLCGDRAPLVQAYARLYNLHFQQADEVARMLDYYNRIAVVK